MASGLVSLSWSRGRGGGLCWWLLHTERYLLAAGRRPLQSHPRKAERISLISCKMYALLHPQCQHVTLDVLTKSFPCKLSTVNGKHSAN